jgi:hypothetical protein
VNKGKGHIYSAQDRIWISKTTRVVAAAGLLLHSGGGARLLLSKITFQVESTGLERLRVAVAIHSVIFRNIL